MVKKCLCDDNSKLKRNARFSCLCNRRWWRNRRCCVMIILNWKEMHAFQTMVKKCLCNRVIDGEEMCCVMTILNWREMCISVVCVIDNGEGMVIILNWREKLFVWWWRMLCDEYSKLKRKARFSCLCNRQWWRNVVWW